MRRYLGAGAILICLIAAGAAGSGQPGPGAPEADASRAPPPVPPPPGTLSEDAKRQCTLQNGDYGYWGLSWRPMCNIRFADGGKACTDKSGCEGRCLLAGDLPRRNKDVSGRCEAHRITYGCSVPILHGVAQKAECLE